jgi:hypothetical protein
MGVKLVSHIERTYRQEAIFKILTAVALRIHVFWNVMQCEWVSGFQCFKGAYYLHLQWSSNPRTLVQNTGNHLPNNTASYPRRPQSMLKVFKNKIPKVNV